MSEMDVYSVNNKNQEGIEEKSSLEIKYQRASLTHRVFARIIDLFIAVVIGVGLFFAVRGIVHATPQFKNIEQRMNQTMLNSGLYVENEDKNLIDIVGFYRNANMTGKAKMDEYEKRINIFLEFAKTDGSSNAYSSIKNDYDGARLGSMIDGNYLFVEDGDNNIIVNPDSNVSYAKYCTQFYEPYIDRHLRSFLVTYFPQYYQDNRTLSTITLALQLPVAVILSSILTYLVPAVIFRRGRKTIGMLVHHISMVGPDLLHVRTGRFLAYEAIFDIGIIALSFLTLGIPMIISLTMILVTKTKSSFAEYMLGITEIDDRYEKVYYNLVEVSSSHLSNKKVSETFKPEKDLQP